MHTSPVLTGTQLEKYHAHLQSDHDFRVYADVLTLEQTFVNSVDILDGQVNYAATNEGSERTASLTLSDPEGALDFGVSFSRDDTGELWVNRLVRVRHQVDVPGIGTVTAIPFIGLPTVVGRKGGEVALELGDKSLLADHGVRPRTYKKGARVDLVLRSILYDLTGERYLRIPVTSKKLSRSYTVGMGENSLTPWSAFKMIAYNEMRWRAYYSCDGYAVCEPLTTAKTKVPIPYVLSLPDSSADFSSFINYVKVTSRRQVQNKSKNGKPKGKPYVVIYEGVAVLPSDHDLSEQGLARNGVPRTLPLVIDDNNLKNSAEVTTKAKNSLYSGSGVGTDQSYEIIPVFHLDKGDMLDLPMGIGVVPFDRASIPLGVGGNMTLGKQKWVSNPVKVSRVKSKRTIIRPKAKGGKAS